MSTLHRHPQAAANSERCDPPDFSRPRRLASCAAPFEARPTWFTGRSRSSCTAWFTGRAGRRSTRVGQSPVERIPTRVRTTLPSSDVAVSMRLPRARSPSGSRPLVTCSGSTPSPAPILRSHTRTSQMSPHRRGPRRSLPAPFAGANSACSAQTSSLVSNSRRARARMLRWARHVTAHAISAWLSSALVSGFAPLSSLRTANAAAAVPRIALTTSRPSE